MATIAKPTAVSEQSLDRLSGTPRAHAIDRWIFVLMAVWFIGLVLAGFIPDSLMKIEQVRTGERAPFPLVLHMHAVLMGSFLILLLAQTWLMATGRRELHMRLGIVAMLLVPLLVVVGFALVPTTYHGLWAAAQAAPIQGRAQALQVLSIWENIMLLQIRIGILFPLFLLIGLRARGSNAGLHKRMMILGTVMALPAGIDRIPWLLHSMPESPLSVDLYTLLAVSPMLAWDVIRNGRVHRAYWIWLSVNLPFALAVHALWDTEWWHSTGRHLMGV